MVLVILLLSLCSMSKMRNQEFVAGEDIVSSGIIKPSAMILKSVYQHLQLLALLYKDLDVTPSQC